MIERLLVLKKARYDFDSQKGSSVEALNEKEATDDKEGYSTIKFKCTSYNVYNSFPNVPGVYDVDFRMDSKSGQQATLSVVNAKLIADVSKDFLALMSKVSVKS